MEKGPAVGNEILEIAKLRSVDGRVVDFRDDAVPDGEPKMAGRRVRCAYAGLVAMCPSGFDPRLTKSSLPCNFLHFCASFLYRLDAGLIQFDNPDDSLLPIQGCRHPERWSRNIHLCFVMGLRWLKGSPRLDHFVESASPEGGRQKLTTHTGWKNSWTPYNSGSFETPRMNLAVISN
jgi:hypothetical protein